MPGPVSGPSRRKLPLRHRLRAIVDALIASEEATKGEESEIQAVEGKPFPTYLLGGELYVSIPGETLFVGSKSYAQIERAMDVLMGRAPSLDSGASNLVRGETEGFFLFASASGLKSLEGMPPQARILQQATGAQFSLGEMGSDLRSQLVLSTENATVSNQLYRIIQGMLALASFAQVENESLSTIVRNAQVEQSPEFVSVDLRYPAEGILKIVEPLIKGEGKVGAGGHEPGKKRDDGMAEAVVDDEVGGEELRVLNVDAQSDNGNLPRHAVDGDPESYWGSSGRGQWIRFQLESHSLVRELQIAWRRGDERRHRFTAQTSPDGVAWEKGIDLISSGATADFESFNIPDTATKWLRLWCNANTVDSMNTISEIRFLGESSYVVPLSEAVTE